LCQTIAKVEWSAVLFYSVKGSIRDFDKVELIVEDIYPMDKGNTSTTGYELGENFIEYRMDNPKTLAWKIGMIHSHHHMKAYFSPTDMSELNDNTEFHNYYLSLVVNNHGALVAKVAFRGNINGYGCKDETGEDWTLRLSKERQAMFTFDCDVKSPKVLTKVPKDFAKRTKEIIEEANVKARAYKTKAQQFQSKKAPYQRNLPAHNYPPIHKKGYNPFDYMGNGDEDNMEEMEANMWNNSFNRDPIKGKKDMTEEERYSDFARYILRLADDIEIVGDDLEGALEDSEIIENGQEYLSSIIVMYPAMFEKYWDIFGEINTERFLHITSETISALDEFYGLFEVVEPLIKALELMTIKMKIDG